MENTKKNTFLTERKYFLLLYRLTNNIVALLFIFNTILFSLYLTGNFQNFLDKSLLFILSALSIGSILCIFLSFCGILENIFFLIADSSRLKYSLFIVLMFLCSGINVFYIVYSTVIRELSIGI